jgi:hypothetical protein
MIWHVVNLSNGGKVYCPTPEAANEYVAGIVGLTYAITTEDIPEGAASPNWRSFQIQCSGNASLMGYFLDMTGKNANIYATVGLTIESGKNGEASPAFLQTYLNMFEPPIAEPHRTTLNQALQAANFPFQLAPIP